MNINMSFSEFLKGSLNEGEDEAKEIRELIKSKYKLSSGDVSIKFKYMGSSSSVDMTIKSEKALDFYGNLKEIVKDMESLDKDKFDGILSGGNTFINLEIDYKLEEKLEDKIKDEFKDKTKNGFEIGDMVSIFDTFTISYFDETNLIGKIKGVNSSSITQSIKPNNASDSVPFLIMNVIKKSKDGSLYTKILK